MRATRKLLFTGIFIAICLMASVGLTQVTYAGRGGGTVPSLPDVCPSLGFDDFTRFNMSGNVTFPATFEADGITLTINAPSNISWTAGRGIDAVVVRGGGQMVYTYDPEASHGEGLTTVLRPDGKYTGVKWVEFCYDDNGTVPPPGKDNLIVTKTAIAGKSAGWHWTIDKWSPKRKAGIGARGIVDVPYVVSLSANRSDGGFFASGEIAVYNPNDGAAVVESVTDEAEGGFAADVSCGVDFPFTLMGGETLNCTYMVALPDNTDRMNTATATTPAGSAIGGGSGTALIDFGDNGTVPDGTVPPAEDECVEVSDDHYGSLGQVCAGDEDKTFEYMLTVGPFAECGFLDFFNTATFTAPSGATGSDTYTLVVENSCKQPADGVKPPKHESGKPYQRAQSPSRATGLPWPSQGEVWLYLPHASR